MFLWVQNVKEDPQNLLNAQSDIENIMYGSTKTVCDALLNQRTSKLALKEHSGLLGNLFQAQLYYLK